jgi:tRNA-specific 2-thiouridylase
MDFARTMREKVIAPSLQEYRRGRTPNPCVECNRALKFDVLYKKARALGFDFLATGHYARITGDAQGRFFLKRPRDTKKDQTYFLYGISREALAHVLFPLATLTKDRVRARAKKAGLPVAEKKESQDLCFVSQRDYRILLDKEMHVRETGDIVDTTGRVRAHHKGIAGYTIGQRKNIGISAREPLYVVDIDRARNRIVVGGKKDLQSRGLVAEKVNLLADVLPSKAYAKIRYGHRPAQCTLTKDKNRIKVMFQEFQESVTPGQSVVWYDEDTVLGGGIIREALR